MEGARPSAAGRENLFSWADSGPVEYLINILTMFRLCVVDANGKKPAYPPGYAAFKVS